MDWNKLLPILCLAVLIVLAGCSGAVDSDNDGLDATAEKRDNLSDSTPNTDGDTLSDGQESRPGTNSSAVNTDADNRTDYEEGQTPGLHPRQRGVINGSPSPGLTNETLRNETRQAVEFLSALPQNRTRRDRVVTTAATKICNAHNRVVPDTVSNATAVSKETYRNTYRVTHAAEVMHDGLGANVEVDTVRSRMQTAREYTSVASKYAPVIGSYQRLYNASCAVKRDVPGSKEDFYIASAAFATDLVLAEYQVGYKASFATTRYVANRVGMMRLARVCGYKCVALVESELHWAIRGTYSGSLDYATGAAIEGNLTSRGWNASVRERVGDYLESRKNLTVIGDRAVTRKEVVDCAKTLDWSDLASVSGDLYGLAAEIVRNGEVPKNVDLSKFVRIDKVRQCLSGSGARSK